MLWSPFSSARKKKGAITCRLSTYRHRFARAALAPRAKRKDSKNRGRASPVKALSNLLSARSLLSHSSKGASKMLRATGHARMVSQGHNMGARRCGSW